MATTTGSKAYELAYRNFMAAGRKFRVTETAYRTGKITDEAYLNARRQYLDAHKVFDIAEANEV